MKIFKYTLLATALIFSSCGKGFLEIEPIGQLGKEQLFADVNGVRDALTGSYSLVAKFMQSEYGIYGDVRADDVTRINTPGSTYMLNDYSYIFNEEDATGSTMTIWADGYAALNNINNVIEGAEELLAGRLNGVETASLQKYVAEAQVLRATVFLALCNVYGQHYTYTADASHLGIPLPLRTPAPGVKLARATVKETYAQIITDLKAGIEGLTQVSNYRIYANADAAKGLLSRVYLYMGDYENAVKYASEVINSGKNNLVPAADYLDMFISNAQRTDFSSIKSEVLWQLNPSGLSSQYMTAFYNSVNFLGSTNSTYLNLFETEDVRRSMIVNTASGNKTLKYNKYAGVTDEFWPINYKVIRSAEVILNRAESYYKQQKYDLAVADIKTIKARALNKSPESIVVSYVSPEELFTIIKNERRKELSFEGHRIYDLMRYKESVNRGADCNAGMCSISYPNDIFVLPIPKTELDANELIKPNPTVNN